jgi:hypothetical protein
MRVGIMLPSRETAMTCRHDARGLVEFAKAAEEAGFDSVWVGDSLLARTRAEPLSILSAVAAVTPALYATVNLNDDKARADKELDGYLRAYYGRPLDVMHYVDAGARHLILRIGSLTGRPQSVAEKLLPALKELGTP